MNRIYLCIDLKSFYASVECVARELDPLTTNLVVADKERTDKTICLAVTPSLKAYIGDCCYQKTYRGTTVPFKQSKNRGEEDMYYATGTHAPIVEKDLFEKVQVLLKKRKEQFTKATTQNIYPLSSRIRCSECGSFYRRKVRSGGVKWVCARHEEDFKACNSNYYSEERRRGTHVACGEQPSGHRYS